LICPFVIRIKREGIKGLGGGRKGKRKRGKKKGGKSKGTRARDFS